MGDINAGNSGAADLRKLVQLISSSCDAILSVYHKIGQDVPSLYDTSIGPFDTPDKTPRELDLHIQTVEAACAQLCASIGSRTHVTMNRAFGFQDSSCLHIAVKLGISDVMSQHPEGLHVQELAQNVGIDSTSLARVLRRLCIGHVFQEITPDVFANNRISTCLSPETPFAALVDLVTGLNAEMGYKLLDTLRENAEEGIHKPPFERTFGQTMFKYMHTEEGREMSENFSKSMVGLSVANSQGDTEDAYPWAKLPENTVVCDVGGGKGHVVMDLLRGYPHLKGVVQDLPLVTEQGKEFWSEQYPEAVTNERIQFIPLDFLNEPPIANCDIYHLRYILHDWSDAESLANLNNVKKSMSASSRLLIHEHALKYSARKLPEDQMVDAAPAPLLPNYGLGSVFQYSFDIGMLLLVTGRERTIPEFITLGEQAGLKFVKFWPGPAGAASVWEFALA